MDVNEAGAEAALQGLREKQDRRKRWGKIAGGVIFVLALLRLGIAIFGGDSVKECDDSEVQSAVSDIIDEAVKKAGGNATGNVKGYSDVQTVQDGDKSRLCTARVTMTDQTTAKATYRIVPKKVTVESLE